MLTLTGRYVRLRVVDEQQQPVRGAQVLTQGDPLVEIGPGCSRWRTPGAVVACPSTRRAWCRYANGRRWRGQAGI